MYEARQRKEKVSRRIDAAGGMARQIMEMKGKVGRNICHLDKGISFKKNMWHEKLRCNFIDRTFNKTFQRVRIINLDTEDATLQDTTQKLSKYYLENQQTLTTDGDLQEDEELIIVAHGDTQEIGSEDEHISYTAEQLGNYIKEFIPIGYKGTIYVNACYSSAKDSNGSSFVTRLYNFLKSVQELNFMGKIKGNSGEAVTMNSGRESVTPRRYGYDY